MKVVNAYYYTEVKGGVNAGWHASTDTEWVRYF